MKRIIVLFLSISFFLLSACALRDDNSVDNYFEHILKEDGTFEVSGSSVALTKWKKDTATIKNKYEKKKVTSIGEGSLICTDKGSVNYYNPPVYLKKIIIKEGIVEIKERAFAGNYFLDSITIPKSVTAIGDSAFADCGGMVIFAEADAKPEGWSESWNPDGNTVIWGKLRTDVDKKIQYGITDNDQVAIIKYLGDKVPSILELPAQLGGKDVSTLVQGSLSEKQSIIIRKIIVPESVSKIGKLAFKELKNLEEVEFSPGSSLTSIDGEAFLNCVSLVSIVLPDTLSSIGESAFENCQALTKIDIPKAVTRIGKSTFSGCGNLRSITLPFVGESRSATGANALFGYIFGNNSYSGGVIATQYYASNSLASYHIPKELKTVSITDITRLGRGAFCNCRFLTSISLPNSLTSIDSYAFYGCSSLEGISVANNVTSIGEYVFANCRSLTSVELGAGFSNIGEGAFLGCIELKNIFIPSGVTDIGERAFFNCIRLEIITIPNTVLNIGSNAFERCSALRNITIPDSVTKIGEGTLSGCERLESIVLPFTGESRTATGAKALFGYIFGSAEYMGGVMVMQEYEFMIGVTYCIPEALKTVSVMDAPVIKFGAFSNCSGLVNIVLSSVTTSLEDYAFSKCSSLKNILVSTGVTSIGNYTFSNCSYLDVIQLPNSLTSIGHYAFSNCTYLFSIEIPNSVTSMGDFVFNGCSNLRSLIIPNSVLNIGKFLVRDCDRLSIYAEAESKPLLWNPLWNNYSRPVAWGYKK